MGRTGFTLIETLVIIVILTILTSFLILYSRTGENQILLLREKAKIISTILRAKGMALNLVVEEEPACGIGIHFEPDGYFLFRDSAIDPRECFVDPEHRRYSGEASGEMLTNEVFNLDPTLRFSRLGVTDVFFRPPQPEAFLDGEQTLPEAEIILATQDDRSSVRIVINNAGQISSE